MLNCFSAAVWGVFDLWRLAFNATRFCDLILARSNEGPISGRGHLKARPAAAADCLERHVTVAGITQLYGVRRCVESEEQDT